MSWICTGRSWGSSTDGALKKAYIRLIYRRAFRLLGVTLALAAVIGGLYAARLYFVYALSAIGCVCLCAAWFGYLGREGMRPFASLIPKPRARVPYALRRDAGKRLHRPSFRQDYTDFDDDLTDRTAVSEEQFSARQAGLARCFGTACCGAILLLLSAVIHV